MKIASGKKHSKKAILLFDSLINGKYDFGEESKIVQVSSIRNLIRQRKSYKYIFQNLFKYDKAVFHTINLVALRKPFLKAILLRMLSRGSCLFTDEQGKSQIIDLKQIYRLAKSYYQDHSKRKSILLSINQAVDELYESSDLSKINRLNLSYSPVYLRTDLVFGLQSGGSVGHIAGVLNNLGNSSDDPIFITTDKIPTVQPGIETYIILPEARFLDFPELPELYFNSTFLTKAENYLKSRRISFIYQRYCVNNFVGLELSRRYGVPFVLEFNGSEIWINKYWGSPLRYEELSNRIETLNLTFADLVIVNSKPMREGLREAGISEYKILVNPNGVNTDRYTPYLSDFVRAKYGLVDKKVIGFIGTFGRWHGAEVLAQSFGMLLNRFPSYREDLRLFLIGDGVTMSEVRRIIANYGVEGESVLTGLVPQENGPQYLAACDILTSPHVPNPDGTPFFGSPTKLFEYMAMGKGIVASDLDQIGDILEHKHTAWLTKPGDAESLMWGLKALLDDDPLRKSLGEAARLEVVEKYTWKEHTRRIVEKLKDLCE